MDERAWQPLGTHPPGELIEERQQLHWAAQPLSAAANVAIERRADDSHTNLGWDQGISTLVTRAFPGGETAALAPLDFVLHWRDARGATLASFELEGNTLDAARAWIAERLRATVGAFPDGLVPLREYAMPPHPIADGQTFSGGVRGRRQELARWFSTAGIALDETARAHPAGSEARIWPHHFDYGLLINFEPERDPEEARSIGVGMSPGDPSGTSQPYYYVNPYPPPQASELPALPCGGYWEQQAYLGALLSGYGLVDGGNPGRQHERVREFLDAAIASCRALLGV